MSNDIQEYMKRGKNFYISVVDDDSVNGLARNIRQQCIIDDPHAPSWSLPIMRAANFICNQLNVSKNVEYSNWKSPVHTADSSSNPVVSGRSRSSEKMPRKRAILHRASTFSGKVFNGIKSDIIQFACR